MAAPAAGGAAGDAAGAARAKYDALQRQFDDTRPPALPHAAALRADLGDLGGVEPASWDEAWATLAARRLELLGGTGAGIAVKDGDTLRLPGNLGGKVLGSRILMPLTAESGARCYRVALTARLLAAQLPEPPEPRDGFVSFPFARGGDGALSDALSAVAPLLPGGEGLIAEVHVGLRASAEVAYRVKAPGGSGAWTLLGCGGAMRVVPLADVGGGELAHQCVKATTTLRPGRALLLHADAREVLCYGAGSGTALVAVARGEQAAPVPEAELLRAAAERLCAGPEGGATANVAFVDAPPDI
eukprot:gene1136-5835_t